VIYGVYQHELVARTHLDTARRARITVVELERFIEAELVIEMLAPMQRK
jgi:hypothetical protein